MQNFHISNLDKLIIKRKARRRKRIKILVILSVVFIMLLGVVYSVFQSEFSNININKVFRKKLNVKTITAPEYVDVQNINIGFARTGVKLIEINNIVIHYVGNPDTTAQNNRDYFNKPDTTVCSHFVIGLEGEIIQCVPMDEKSNASNNRNLDTISIEVCHPDSTGKFNESTYDSLVKLTAWLCDNSGLDEDDVIRHYDITGKVCPKYFVDNESEWDFFKKDIQLALENY